MRFMRRSVSQSTAEPAIANRRSLAIDTRNRDAPGTPGKLPQKNKVALKSWIIGGSIGLVGLVLILLPNIVDLYTLSLLYTMFIYLALAQSWNLVGGYTGLVSLGHAAFFGLGAYTTAMLMTTTTVPFFVAIIASGLLATSFAAAIALPVFRFRGIYFAIGTLVLAEALHLWMINWSLTGGAQGLNLPLTNSPDQVGFYYIALAIAAATTGLLALILRGKLGIGLRAIRDNEDAAQNMGVNTFRVKLSAFALSAFIAGLIGGIHAVYLGTIEPYSIFSIDWTTTAISIVIIGGIGTLIGPIIGAAFVTLLAEWLADYQMIHLIITGLIMILIIRFLPAGIWGQLRRIPLLDRVAKKIRMIRSV
jgi:branched-chain amino acid transport system permease protein